ncbi:hypothetical protein H0H93_005460 [Arthromyces matolae]|nr:hypothetical protein H0H93_005460 [Arthromyces matolae]
MGDTMCLDKFNAVDKVYCIHFTVLNNYLDALLAKHPRHSNLFKSLDGIASIHEGKALAKRIIEESDRDRASVGITLRAQAVVFLHHWNTKPPSKPSSEGPDPTLSQSELTSIANDISKEENGTNVGKLLQEVNSCISDHIKKGKAEVAGGNKPGAKELGYEIAFAREASVLWFLNDGIREEAKEYRFTLSEKQPVKATAVTAPRRNSA